MIVWTYHVYVQKLTWYFSGVYIIRSFMLDDGSTLAVVLATTL